MQMMTVRKYVLSDVVSAMQKAIRRGDARVAGYFAIEMFESGYAAYAWRRLLTVSAEDCAGVITQEIKALYDSWLVLDKSGKGRGRIFLSKAVVLLCQARKSRDADHLTNLVYDAKAIDERQLERALLEARTAPEALPIPGYAFDCHTSKGHKAGKTRGDFFLSEHDALTPRQSGLFDEDLERLRKMPPAKRDALLERPKGKK
jgi:replication-associated recombination protein RarA